jgi:hypothetical protein
MRHGNGKKPATPFGSPGAFPLFSPESRAAARAMANASIREKTMLLIHSVPRPNHPGRPAPERTKDGNFVMRITCS